MARQLGLPQERRASGNSPRNSLELHDTPEKAVNCLSFGYLPAGALGIVGFRSIGKDTTRRDVSKPIGSGRDAEALSRSADYRVLRRLVPRPTSLPAAGQEVRTGILLDTETTGLDHAKDEMIELGMVKFDYTPDGRIVGSATPSLP